MPDTLRSETWIRALWLVDNALLLGHSNPAEAVTDFPAFHPIPTQTLKLGILRRMTALKFGDERIAADAVTRFFEQPVGLMDNCCRLNAVLFEPFQGLPMLRVDTRQHEFIRMLEPDSLLCLHQGLRLPRGERYDWPEIPLRDGHHSNSVLRDGSVDTHIHLGGTLPPLFYWLVLMTGELPFNVAADYCASSAGLRGFAGKETWSRAMASALWARMALARTVQAWSRGQAFPYLPTAESNAWSPWSCEKSAASWLHLFAATRDNLAAFDAQRRHAVPCGKRHWPFWDPLRLETGLGSQRPHYAQGERRLLLCLGDYLCGARDDPQRACVEALLLHYLRVKNAFHQLLVHDHGSDGLMRFIENFARRGLYFGFSGQRLRRQRLLLDLERARMTAALDMQLRHGFHADRSLDDRHQPVRALEMRVSVTENKLFLRTLRAWLDGMARHIQPVKGRDSLASQIGLLFHVGKALPKPYENNAILARKAHDNARKLGCVLQDFPYLRPLVVGYDAAGDERNSPPRQFVAAFQALRDLQSRLRPEAGVPPVRLGWTYHVGEDYADLMSALRHIDEVCCLLLRSEGGRLGHALALGESPQRFYQRRRHYTELALGSHVLDLVWAHGRLTEMREVADVPWLSARIAGLLYQGGDDEGAVRRCYREMNLQQRLPEQRREDELLAILGVRGAAAKRSIALRADERWVGLCAILQTDLRRRLAFQRLCVEANPTSNLLIGAYDHYGQLPYRTLVDARMALSLNTDDPGLFMTSLSGEYSAMYLALAQSGEMSHAEILAWLDRRLFDARQSTFLGNHVPIGRDSPVLNEGRLNRVFKFLPG